jgi:predicted dehydrogenase
MLTAALVGAGYWGPNLANAIERTGKAVLGWLCDSNPKHLSGLARRYPHAATTTDIGEILRDEHVDAVIVATPTATHYELGRRALEAGKHTLIEKPLATRSRDAAALLRLAEARRRVLMVGHVFEYNAAVRAVGELIKSGELGEVYYMSFERTNLGPVRTDVNALWDLAAHDASIMCDFMSAAPVSVTAKGQCYLNPGIEDVVFATFVFEGGAAAHVHASWLNPSKVRQITVVGSRKMAICDDLDLRFPVRLYDKRVGLPPVSEITGSFLQHKTLVIDSGATIPVIQTREPLLTEVDDFFGSIVSGGQPRADGVSGWRVVRLMEAAAESIACDSRVVPVNFSLEARQEPGCLGAMRGPGRTPVSPVRPLHGMADDQRKPRPPAARGGGRRAQRAGGGG